MKKIVKTGLVGMLLVGIATASNEVPLNKRNHNKTTPIVTTTNLFKGIKLAKLPEIKFSGTKIQKQPKYDRTKRLDEKTLDEFIDFTYARIKVSDIVDKKFVKSIINAESERYVYAKSKVGARGLMQLMPDTWNLI